MSEQDNATDFIQSSNKAREYENKKKNKSTKHKCTGWAIVATMERPNHPIIGIMKKRGVSHNNFFLADTSAATLSLSNSSTKTFRLAL